MRGKDFLAFLGVELKTAEMETMEGEWD